jgi:hypothetical protein
MTFEKLELLVLGTAVCCFGFFRWPKSAYELIRPRFAIPFLFWLATFLPMISYGDPYTESNVYQRAREDSGRTAAFFIMTCLLGFWVGFASPIGVYLAKPMALVTNKLPIRPQRFGILAYLVGGFSLFLIAILNGPAFLGFEGGGPLIQLPESLGRPVAVIMVIGTAVSAAALGASWPAKGSQSLFGNAFRLLFLLALCTPNMAMFSRGSALPVLICFAAFSVRHRRLNWVIAILAVGFTALCGHAGLAGRGVMGHYAGVFPYLQFLFTESLSRWDEMFSIFTGAVDAYTPLCVTMQAVKSTDIHAVTWTDWLLIHIPIPYSWGFQPELTTDLSYFIRGASARWYTLGLFGDLWAHFGWAGWAVMAVLGMLYRMLDHLIIGQDLFDEHDHLNPYMFLMFTSYYAMMVGLFNNFRSWTTLFFYPLFLTVAILLVFRFFIAHRSQENVDGSLDYRAAG